MTTIQEFLDANPKLASELGGVQGNNPGQITIPFTSFTVQYQPGSMLERIVEAYAGVHDAFNSVIWYDSLGNNKHLTGASMVIGEAINWGNVLLATPFAIAVGLPPGLWNTLGLL
jgi:hypothetical protein